MTDERTPSEAANGNPTTAAPSVLQIYYREIGRFPVLSSEEE